MNKLNFCRIADIFDRERRYLFTAKVSEVVGGVARLNFPMCDILNNMEVEGFVTFYDDVEGLVTYWCSFYDLKRISGENTVTMTSSMVDLIGQVQRRQDLKCSSRFKIEINYTDEENVVRACEGEVENISAGGVFFTSEKTFEATQEVTLILDDISFDMRVQATILRAQDLEGWESSPWLRRDGDRPATTKEALMEQTLRVKPQQRQLVMDTIQKQNAQLENLAREVEYQHRRNRRRQTEIEIDFDVGGDTVRTGYGCRFRRVTGGDEVFIRKFVFEQERLRLRA